MEIQKSFHLFLLVHHIFKYNIYTDMANKNPNWRPYQIRLKYAK